MRGAATASTLHLSSQAPYCVALPAARQWCPEAHRNAACYIVAWSTLQSFSLQRKGTAKQIWADFFQHRRPHAPTFPKMVGRYLSGWSARKTSCSPVEFGVHTAGDSLQSGNATIGKLRLRTCLPLSIVTSRIITTTRCPCILCADSLLQLLLTSRVTNEKRRLEMGPNIWGKGCNGLPNS